MGALKALRPYSWELGIAAGAGDVLNTALAVPRTLALQASSAPVGHAEGRLPGDLSWRCVCWGGKVGIPGWPAPPRLPQGQGQQGRREEGPALTPQHIVLAKGGLVRPLAKSLDMKRLP